MKRGNEKKIMQGRVTENKIVHTKRSEENTMNYIVGLTNCTRLKGTLAATLYCSFNFKILMESAFVILSTIRKTGIFPCQG